MHAARAARSRDTTAAATMARMLIISTTSFPRGKGVAQIITNHAVEKGVPFVVCTPALVGPAIEVVFEEFQNARRAATGGLSVTQRMACLACA